MPGEYQPEGRVGELVGGRYELTEYMESGAVGDIYRALDHRLEFRQVCVKLVKPDTSTDQLARFKREALLTGGLSSPHLVTTSDFGLLPDGQAFLVMELLRGESLERLLEREGTLPLPRALRIADGILAGLEAAHDAGVVHRDLKPDNVFVVREPGIHDHVKLLDFGFAKIYSEAVPALDVTGEDRIVVGTVSYMAPEQLRGRASDHRTDLFSVGAMLFRMLTGRLPYDTKSGSTMVSSAMFRAVRLDQPPQRLTDDERFTELARLDAVLTASLSVDPAQRPSSAGALRRALAEATGAAALPPEASQPGASAERWRNPASGVHDFRGLDAPPPVRIRQTAPQPPVEAEPPPPAAEPPVEPSLDPAVTARARLYGIAGGVVLLLVSGWFIWRATT